MIEKIIIISLITFAIYATLQEGMIFQKLGDMIERLPDWLSKPLGGCVVCSGFWYGIAAYFALPYLPEWLVIGISVIGLNFILTKFFKDD